MAPFRDIVTQEELCTKSEEKTKIKFSSPLLDVLENTKKPNIALVLAYLRVKGRARPSTAFENLTDCIYPFRCE